MRIVYESLASLNRRRLALGVLAAVVLSAPAGAEPMTFATALARASENAPSLQGAALQVEAARASARAAGALPDPQVKLGVENYPISGPNSGRFGDDEMTMATIGLMQDVPNRGRREGETSLAQAQIEAAEAQVRVERRDVRLAAALAWIDLYYSERRLAALDKISATLEPLWEAAPAGVASGASRPSAGLAPIRMRADLDDQRSELKAAVGKAQAELARWTGDPAVGISGEPPVLSVEPALLRAGLEQQPTLHAFGAAERRARAELAMARAGKRPDWAFELEYGRRDSSFGDMVSAGVTMSLPVFSQNRQDPVIAARTSDAARVAVERETMRRSLASGLEADLADYAMRRDQWMRTRDVVLPAAIKESDLETASYGAGRVDLAGLLDAFTQLAEARLTLLEREAAMARDAARITFTYGSETP